MVLEKIKKKRENNESKVVMIDRSVITPEMCEEIHGEWDDEKGVCIVEERKLNDATIFKKIPVKKLGKSSSEKEYE